MFNVKRLQVLESLILETELIQIGSDTEDLINKAKNSKSSGSGSSGDDNEDMNRILDWLFNLGEDDLRKKLEDPTLFKTFSNPGMKAVLDKYFIYLNERISVFRKELLTALDKEELNELEINRITDKITRFVCRVRVVEVIYETLGAKSAASEFADDIRKKVDDINKDLSEIYALRITKPAEKTKQAYSKFQGAQTPEEKEEAAKEVFANLETAEILADGMPEEVTSGIDDAINTYTGQISSEIGKEKTDDIKNGIFVNKDVASLVRKIFEFQHTAWSNENDILTEANKLRTSVNGFPEVSQDAKEYLVRLIDQVQKALIERVKNKEFDTKKYKGIHYDFNKKLPLYERTSLPVTGKQIADDSKLMKFRKASQDLMNLLFKGSDETVAGKAFKDTGKWLHTIYAKTLNGAAKLIGKAVGGREGEMKADAVSRMFILDTTVVDEPKPKQVSEDGVAPGVSPQVPGSIGSMGPIVAPTADSVGSGDKFISMDDITTKKKKKKSAILGFADFIKEQNNTK
jgi:hypothetical protein